MDILISFACFLFPVCAVEVWKHYKCINLIEDNETLVRSTSEKWERILFKPISTFISNSTPDDAGRLHHLVVKFGKHFLLSGDTQVAVDNSNESSPSREITFIIPKQNSKLVTSALPAVIRQTYRHRSEDRRAVLFNVLPRPEPSWS
jgi:hypothetical protein